jgi:hypothetical protein
LEKYWWRLSGDVVIELKPFTYRLRNCMDFLKLRFFL